MMSNARRNRLAPQTAALLVLALFGLSACSTIGDTLPEKAGGLPANAPARPADALPTPNVYEIRPTREAAPPRGLSLSKLNGALAAGDLPCAGWHGKGASSTSGRVGTHWPSGAP